MLQYPNDIEQAIKTNNFQYAVTMFMYKSDRN